MNPGTSNSLSLLARMAPFVCAVLYISGCTAPTTSDGSVGAFGEENQSAQDIPRGDFSSVLENLVSDAPLCGVRTVRTAPSNVHLSFEITESTFVVTPADSDFAAVVAPVVGCDRSSNPLDDFLLNFSPLQVLEIGPGGEWLSSCILQDDGDEKIASCTIPPGKPLFVVDDGCLGGGFEPDSFDEEDFPQDVEESSPVVLDPLCPNGQFPLSRRGLVGFIGSDEEFICLEIELKRSCLDCAENGGVWSQSLEVNYDIVALGDLDNISLGLLGLSCGDGRKSIFDVRAGDRVSFRQSAAFQYSLSDGPAELGFDVDETELLTDSEEDINIPDRDIPSPDDFDLGDFDPENFDLDEYRELIESQFGDIFNNGD